MTPFYRWSEGGTEKFTNVSQVTQLLSGRVKIWFSIFYSPPVSPTDTIVLRWVKEQGGWLWLRSQKIMTPERGSASGDPYKSCLHHLDQEVLTFWEDHSGQGNWLVTVQCKLFILLNIPTFCSSYFHSNMVNGKECWRQNMSVWMPALPFSVWPWASHTFVPQFPHLGHKGFRPSLKHLAQNLTIASF